MGLFGGGGPDYDEAIAELRQGADTATQRLDPWMSSGTTAQGQLMSQLGMGDQPAFDVTQLPGYQQSLEQSLRGVNEDAAGAGMLMSGSRLKGLGKASQDVFGQYYQDYMNRITGIGQQGLGASTQAGQWGMGAAQGISGMMQQQADADAAAKAGEMSDMLSLAGMGAGMMAGGPMGASMGSQMGSSLGGGGSPMSASSQSMAGAAPPGSFNLTSMGGF